VINKSSVLLFLQRVLVMNLVTAVPISLSTLYHYHHLPHWSVFAASLIASFAGALFLTQKKRTIIQSSQKPVAYNHGQNLDMEGVQALINQGKKIHAVKLYRENTGCGLKEAAQAVSDLELSLNDGVSH